MVAVRRDRRRRPRRRHRAGRQLTGEATVADAGAAAPPPPPRAWYAAYGSNCDAERLRAYLRGGTYPPTGVAHVGSADPAPPSADRPWTFDQPVRFAGRSRAWGGATAVLDDGPGLALGRVWQLSWRQLEDVYAQENGAAHRAVSLAQVRHGARVHTGGYARLRELGSLQGLPVVTFTAAQPRAEPVGAPSALYLATIARGLAAVHPLTPDELAARLRDAAGVAEGWGLADLRELIATAG